MAQRLHSKIAHIGTYRARGLASLRTKKMNVFLVRILIRRFTGLFTYNYYGGTLLLCCFLLVPYVGESDSEANGNIWIEQMSFAMCI
jgi:hypothetical protein